ncbi:MAG: hypothetical protein GF313_16335 [Caldithrix sp.]|nr:hypothetical protein [Caldithrix sp.]
MRLPPKWESFLKEYLPLNRFYTDLHNFVHGLSNVMPRREYIFHVLTYMNPQDVQCVLYGEDPYPRTSSANGVAFWDEEIQSWQDKTNGSALKNILKGLMIAQGLATYDTPIADCRHIARQNRIKSPPQLFRLWLKQGVLLINASMTFSRPGDKKYHFKFWHPFHTALITALNDRQTSPFYVLWGRKAQYWQAIITESIDDSDKILTNGHPTFIHQFLNKSQPDFSPFTALMQKTGIRWL